MWDLVDAEVRSGMVDPFSRRLQQVEADVVPATGAARKRVAGDQHHPVGRTVSGVEDFVDAGTLDGLAGLELAGREDRRGLLFPAFPGRM